MAIYENLITFTKKFKLKISQNGNTQYHFSHRRTQDK